MRSKVFAGFIGLVLGALSGEVLGILFFFGIDRGHKDADLGFRLLLASMLGVVCVPICATGGLVTAQFLSSRRPRAALATAVGTAAFVIYGLTYLFTGK
ncbi:MAG: hypothetical protein ACRENK_04555 [Gemmatimonadaceae bacterium]